MFSILLAVFSLAFQLTAQNPAPALSEKDRIRIAEAFRITETLGNRVWPGWESAPMAVLLVTADREFLIRHPRPSDDFTFVAEDSMLRSKIWSRPRKYPANFLATFPAVNGLSTVVIGQAENTEARDSSRWVITLLHEHFHQLQDSQPKFYEQVNALGLARGDATGMWMLDYPFPYSTPAINDHFSIMAGALADALAARQRPDFDVRLSAYIKEREKFRSMLKEDDYKYFAFQIWKEGIACYTEYKTALLAFASFEPSKEFRALNDYNSFRDVAQEILSGIERELRSVRLDKQKRTVVYNFGAAEGLVLDRAKPEWRAQYLAEKFSLDKHFQQKK